MKPRKVFRFVIDRKREGWREGERDHYKRTSVNEREEEELGCAREIGREREKVREREKMCVNERERKAETSKNFF